MQKVLAAIAELPAASHPNVSPPAAFGGDALACVVELRGVAASR